MQWGECVCLGMGEHRSSPLPAQGLRIQPFPLAFTQPSWSEGNVSTMAAEPSLAGSCLLSGRPVPAPYWYH